MNPVLTSTTTPARRWRRWRRAAGSAALNLAAAGGAVCLLALIAAWVFGITIILFKTGSMAPTIPAGSAAIVREVPVSQVRVGDVVTVDRLGKLPVTHRVIAIDQQEGASRALTLQGDANPAADPEPYAVDTVRIVLFSIPGVAPWFVAARHPAVMALITVAVTALVVWVLWPHHQRPATGGDRHG